MREISIGDSDLTVNGKRYDRAKATELFVKVGGEKRRVAQNQNYDEIARKVALDPLGGSPGMAKASAMAADATTAAAGLVAGGIDATGKKLQMMYDGKAVVIAKWLSVERALFLANMIGTHIGVSPNVDGTQVRA